MLTGAAIPHGQITKTEGGTGFLRAFAQIKNKTLNNNKNISFEYKIRLNSRLYIHKR